MKYLDSSGLIYVLGKIKTLLGGKVDAVSGKGLSTNDYTTTEKNKLSGIASNAQVNVIETVKVNNTALTPSSKAVNIDLSNYALKSDVSSVYRVKGSCTWAVLIAKTDAEVGDVWNVTDKGGANYVCTTAKKAGADNWDKLGETIDLSTYATNESLNSHKNNTSNPHGVTKAQVGLGNVDNTSDANKPISTATQNALNLKANDADLATVAKTGNYSDISGKPSFEAITDTEIDAMF